MPRQQAKTQDKTGLFEKQGRLALTASEVAALIGLSRNSVYLMVHRKQIPFVRIGRRVRFLPAQIEAWLHKKRS